MGRTATSRPVTRELRMIVFITLLLWQDKRVEIEDSWLMQEAVKRINHENEEPDDDGWYYFRILDDVAVDAYERRLLDSRDSSQEPHVEEVVSSDRSTHIRETCHDHLEFLAALIREGRRLSEIEAQSSTPKRGATGSNDEADEKLSSDLIHYLVLAALFSKEIKVLEEIYTLLANGYTEAAHARCRTLYECFVLTFVFVNATPEIAERFHAAAAHEESYYRRTWDSTTADILPLKAEWPDNVELRQEVERNEALYGKARSYYEWARPFVLPFLKNANEPVSFQHLELSVGLQPLRVTYIGLTKSIHITPVSICGEITSSRARHPEMPPEAEIKELTEMVSSWFRYQSKLFFHWACWRAEDYDLYSEYGALESIYRNFREKIDKS